MTEQRQPSPRNQMWDAVDWDQTFAQRPLEADAWSMMANLRYLPYRSFPLYVAQLSELSVAKNRYRGRYLCVPYGLETVPARGNFDSNEHVNVGSVVWGFSFAAINSAAVNFQVGVRDACSGLEFFEGTPVANHIQPASVGTAAGLNPVLIEPRRVEDAAGHPKLEVRIRNNDTVDRQCQLIIYMAEPCSVQGV